MDLERDEYQEPRCPLDMSALQGGPAETIPVRRITEKEDEFLAKNYWTGAERLLLYWLAEADQYGDKKGCFAMNNELMGLYRKLGKEEKAMESAGKALELQAELGMENSISAGTTYVNVATACNAFGEYERSLELFGKARAVYENSSFVEPRLLGGLYNNMALTCTALSKYDEALALYEKAVSVMAKVPDGGLEQAITCLNMADTVEAWLGMEEGESRIFELADRAEELLDDKGRELLRRPDGETSVLETPGALKALPAEEKARIGYYAFVCEKCAPVFEYYGYFLTADRLRETAEKIYAEE